MFLAQVTQATPYVVEVIEAPTPETTVADILLGAVGLTGAIVLGAILFGLVLGGLLVGLRNWRPKNPFNGQTAADVSLRLHVPKPPLPS
jgi:hypothetical protein